MDVQLYKFEIIKGKEKIAEEWLNFLKENKSEGLKTLKNERVYFESYFKEFKEDKLYVYIFMMCEDYKFAQKTALESDSFIDKKHAEYFNLCCNLEFIEVLNSELVFDNLIDKK